MIKYIVKKGETLESIAEDFGITVPELRYYHNDVCELKNLIGDKVKAGTELLLEKGKPSKEKLQEIQQEKEEKQEEQKIQETQEERESHEGSHFLVHGAKCICNKGTIPATLKVTSHTHLVLNNKTQDKYAATEKDLQFEEGSSCFGNCKLRKNDPCIYSPAGKWKKPYKYTKVFDMSILTELSYLNCTTGGKISVDYHGQKIKIGFMNLQRADSELLNQVMPGLELQEYIEKQDIVLEGETEKREEVEALSDKTPQILKAVLLDNTGNLLDKVLSYGESFILRILTHNMRGKSLNFSVYDVVNDKEIEVEGSSKPLKVEQDNGIVKSDLIHLNIGMPMKTRQDMGSETHQYRLRIFSEDRTLIQEARFNVKNQKVDSQFIPSDIQVPVKVGKLSNIGKEEKEEEDKKGGIHTRFYDEQGTQVYEIPQKLHKAFNEEYGIKIAYDKENEMLYYEGECTPAYEKTSPIAIGHWKRELSREQISKGKLLFGYNFGYKITSNYSEWKEPIPNNKDKVEEIMFGVCPYVQRRKHSIALIDLGDYDENLQPLGVSYKLRFEDKAYDMYHLEKPQFSNRYMGLARGLEHEFIGHVILNYHDDPELYNAREPSEIEIKLGNKIREEIGVPGRLNSTVSNITLDDGRKVPMFITGYGFINGSDNSDPDIYVYPFAPDPAPKFPLLEGYTRISQENVLKFYKINYTVTLNYKYNEKIFDFI